MLAFESPQFRSPRPSHLTHVTPASSPVSNDGFFWDNSTGDTHPFSSYAQQSGREHRRFSYAGTTVSGDSGLHSGYSVSSILQGSEADHLMDSMSSIASSHVGSNTPETDLWMTHTTPPHSAPPIPRNEPFEYFQQHPVTCQASLPTFQDAYVSNATITLRPNLWCSPFRVGVATNSGNQHSQEPPWASASGSSVAPGTMHVDEYSGGSRFGLPWSQESPKYPDPVMMLAAVQQSNIHRHQQIGASNVSDSSSDAGSISSPTLSPPYYTSQATGHFNFPGHHMSPHPTLHRTKSSPTTFGRTHEPDSSGQVCAVCGDHAACQHYGVRTCEGCKGFFKRTVQKSSKYVCLGNKDCLVDKKRRNRCQFCRYQKCLAVGMVKEVVRTDSLKGRRGRLPSKPKNLSDRDNSARLSSTTTSSRHSGSSSGLKVDLITCLVNTHHDCSPQVCLDYQTFGTTTIKNTQEETERFLSVLTHSLSDMVATWVDKIPGLRSEISPDDCDVLINSASLELVSTRLSYRLLADAASGADHVRLCNGVAYPRELAARVMGPWLAEIEQLSRSLQSMDLDTAGFASLCALVLVQDRPFLNNNAPVLNLQTKILDALREYTNYNAQSLHNLLGKLQEIRTVGQRAVHQLKLIHAQNPAVKFPDVLRQIIASQDISE